MRGIYLKNINLKGFERDYSSVNDMFFKFLFIHKVFFARVCFLMIHHAWQNFAREKWRHEAAKILRGFVFVLFWNLVFICKGSQPRIYADLIRFQSRLRDSIHIIIFMKSIIPFLIYSFHVLTFAYEQEKSKNKM